MATRFFVNGEQIEIIDGPNEFYDTLLEESSKARRRIIVSSLYLGTGELEKNLVETWKTAIRDSDDGFRAKFLMDYNRGTRGGEKSSRTMLLPLLHESQRSGRPVRLSFFHTPLLRGLLRRLLPERVNELVSTHHMKIYAFDDNVIISGANLSNDYFTRRVDRYYLIRGAHHLVDYFEELVDVMGQLSFSLDENGSLVFEHKVDDESGTSIHPYKGNQKVFCRFARRLIEKFANVQFLASTSRAWKGDTSIIPLLQMSMFEVTDDVEATTAFLHGCEPESQVDLASGYFNLIPAYRDCLMESTGCKVNIVNAAPVSNGFFDAGDSASYIPYLFTYVMKLFIRYLNQYPEQMSRFTMWEFARPKWVFHAKGLWYTPASRHHPGLSTGGPTVTFIGSSNFGYRSADRDVENQLIIQTSNVDLRQRLGQERDKMFSYAKPLDFSEFDRRHVPWFVRLLAPLARRVA